MNTAAFPGIFGNLGVTELIIILIIVLLLFGAGRIRTIMREMGGGISEFKKGIREGEEEKKPPAPSKDSSKDSSKVNPN